MLNHKTLTVVFSLLTVALSASKSSDQQSPLNIEILNVQKNQGKIVVEIYKDEASWLESPFRKATLSTDGVSKTASFNIPHGKYAISIYQDINENGKLDMNFLGIPKEPVGFGNNYRPFGKPKFESASIEHTSTSKPKAIKLDSAF